MFTRFRTESTHHLFEVSFSDLPREVAMSTFLCMLVRAYGDEDEYFRASIRQDAAHLRKGLESPEFLAHRGVAKLVRSLDALLEFIDSTTEPTLCFYSYDRSPSINDILDAFAKGGGADDWAIEELASRGGKGRTALLKVLEKDEDRDRLLAAVSMLLISFRDDRTIAAVRRFVDTCDPNVGESAAVLLAAYTSA